jgi:hypothetical protein
MKMVFGDFVTVEKDEFKERTDIAHCETLRWKGNKLNISYRLRFLEFNDKRKRLVLDLNCISEHGWKPRELAFLIGGRKKALKINVFRNEAASADFGYARDEYCILDIDVKLLKELCDATSLKIRLDGEKQYSQPEDEWCERFQKYCRQFYNNVFDANVFLESVAGLSPKQEKLNDEDRVSKRNSERERLATLRNQLLVSSFFVLVFVFLLFSSGSSAEGVALLSGGVFVAVLCCAFFYQIKISKIDGEIERECPKCHKSTVRRLGEDVSVYAVRSEQQIIGNKITGENESRQVVVTDQKVTQKFTCTSCSHCWSASYIRTID